MKKMYHTKNPDFTGYLEVTGNFIALTWIEFDDLQVP